MLKNQKKINFMIFICGEKEEVCFFFLFLVFGKEKERNEQTQTNKQTNMNEEN